MNSWALTRREPQFTYNSKSEAPTKLKVKLPQTAWVLHYTLQQAKLFKRINYIYNSKSEAPTKQGK